MYMHHMVSYGMCNAVRILQSLLYMYAVSIKSMMQLRTQKLFCLLTYFLYTIISPFSSSIGAG